jgi:hypothetical protein
MGLKNNNPILDTQTYNVGFPVGKVTENTANIIDDESMCAQCDLDGNQQHLLLKCIVIMRQMDTLLSSMINLYTFMVRDS